MTAKVAKQGGVAGGMHTAGIFSDMTVDGPETGTLVVIVDRAKNLPNRKTMGKQDPYCAARLGKEAKKTETDKRGGQTPKWDQEIRFTVHDSPDYHSLKVSVFNDDKRTELIGEAWVTLGGVVIPGGGQCDTWQGLNCRGKYAGEIRLELTYYDTRTKDEKPEPEVRMDTARNGFPEGQVPSLSGPRERTPVKRRPLPSEPTGASPSPVSLPEPTKPVPTSQAGSRSQYIPPRQPSDVTPVSHRRSFYNTQQPHPVNSRPTSEYPYDSPTPSRQQYEQHDDEQIPPEVEAYEHQPANVRHRMSAVSPHHNRQIVANSQTRVRPHSYMEMPHSHSAPVVPSYGYPLDSPHGTPEHFNEHDENIAYEQQENNYQSHRPSVSHPYSQRQPERSRSYFEDELFIQDPPLVNGYGEPSMHRQSFENSERLSARAMQPTVEDENEVPPPPPVHRSSAPAIVPLRSTTDRQLRHEMVPSPLQVPSDVGRRQSYHPPPEEDRFQNEGLTPPPRAPLSAVGQRQGYRPASQDDLRQYDHTPSPQSTSDLRYQSSRPPYQEPARPNSRGTTIISSARADQNSAPYADPARYDPVYPGQARGGARPSNRVIVKQRSHPASPASSQLQQYDGSPQYPARSQSDYQTPPLYSTPPRAHPLSQQELPPTHSTSYNATPSQELAPMIKPLAISPADQSTSRTSNRNTPTRKSVSPRTSIDPGSEARRPSGTPFSPDSFDAYNPNIRPTSSGTNNTVPVSAQDRSQARQVLDPAGKILGFDGREIDPSDHLPVDSWAPEPEVKGRTKEKPLRERERLTGARELGGARRDRERPVDASIRNAVNGSLRSSPVQPDSPANSPLSSRSRPQKRNSGILREGGYSARGNGSTSGFVGPGSGSMGLSAPPPVPAKIPFGNGDGGLGSDDLGALSEEMKSIDIGSGTVGRRNMKKAKFYS